MNDPTANHMSLPTRTDLQARYSALINETRAMEKTANDARNYLEELDGRIAEHRQALFEVRAMLILAEGDAAIRPDSSAEALIERAQTLRSLYGWASGLVHRLEDAARQMQVAGAAEPAETAAPATDGETPMRTVWGAYLHGDGLFQIGYDDTIVEARARAVGYLESTGVVLPAGACWEPHGSHKEVLMVDGQPFTVDQLGRILQVVIAEKDVPDVVGPPPGHLVASGGPVDTAPMAASDEQDGSER